MVLSKSKTTKSIAIIGSGFSGMMTAVHLIRLNTIHKIILIDQKNVDGKGIAYNPYSKRQLLNVIGSKMSAFHDTPGHFVDWLKQHPNYKSTDEAILNNAFLPRHVYGEYLENIWNEHRSLHPDLQIMQRKVVNVVKVNSAYVVELDNNQSLTVDAVVLATGNHLPRNPVISTPSALESRFYFQNPWSKQSVTTPDKNLPVLVVGNGLTMVDTVIGLYEQGYTGKIYSISANGFHLLPHRHPGIQYKALISELSGKKSLRELVQLFRKHVRIVRSFGVSAEPVIDSLRMYTAELWQSLSPEEKKYFMRKLRHMWGVARHRVPLHIHDWLQKLRFEQKLVVMAGKIEDMVERENGLKVTFRKKDESNSQQLLFGRVINCTGPESDFSKLNSNHFLHKLVEEGMIVQDDLKLGIQTNVNTFVVKDRNNNDVDGLFTIGSNLKGMFWESTAVGELRVQAEKLAHLLAND